MSEFNRAELFARLNPLSYQALEGATAFCKLRGHPYVELVHWVYQLINTTQSDWQVLLQQAEVDEVALEQDILRALDRLPKGAGAISDLSHHIDEVVQSAWLYASLQCQRAQIRSGDLLIATLQHASLKQVLRQMSSQFARVSLETVLQTANQWQALSAEQESNREHSAEATAMSSVLEQYAQNLTQKAREGALDPVLGRDDEIRQMIDILLRRRQNNPLLAGEAGVGKTAIVEGLAQRLVHKEVPPALQGVELYLLDMGLLQAGAGVKGEFEKRLVQLLESVEQSPVPIILFIDEIHTLIGAGGTEGTGDAANLLKPALARGQLRTIGATTWSEYKKYIEKDPALTRRFQVVTVEEPTAEQAREMLQGIANHLSEHHQVLILDEAIRSAVQLSQRYIPARQLPDKAVALLDTAAARVAISQHTLPAPVERAQRELDRLHLEYALYQKEKRLGLSDAQMGTQLEEELEQAAEQLAIWEKRWQQERALTQEIVQTQQQLCNDHEAEAGFDLQERLFALRDELFALQGEQPLVYAMVDTAIVAAVVADWTGIPVGRMVKNELDDVLQLAPRLAQRVLGQDHALTQIAQRIQSARARILDPHKPAGVFLLCGPSGVGKTETALALADALYGGEHNVITINMSEFQEAHTVSALKGAPPGYVGYGEGGRLTEAVRRKPYSVVLLDEIEKAHPDVHELFFQVFDKGWMEDGEGRRVDFRNTLILLTSNVGTDEIADWCEQHMSADLEQLESVLRPALLDVFPPALLGRMTVIPYLPLDVERLARIARLQWQRLAQRVYTHYQAQLHLSEAALQLLLARCRHGESGGRMIEAALNQYIMPKLSQYLLQATLDQAVAAEIKVCAAQDEFVFYFNSPLSGS